MINNKEILQRKLLRENNIEIKYKDDDLEELRVFKKLKLNVKKYIDIFKLITKIFRDNAALETTYILNEIEHYEERINKIEITINNYKIIFQRKDSNTMILSVVFSKSSIDQVFKSNGITNNFNGIKHDFYIFYHEYRKILTKFYKDIDVFIDKIVRKDIENMYISFKKRNKNKSESIKRLKNYHSCNHIILEKGIFDYIINNCIFLDVDIVLDTIFKYCDSKSRKREFRDVHKRIHRDNESLEKLKALKIATFKKWD